MAYFTGISGPAFVLAGPAGGGPNTTNQAGAPNTSQVIDGTPVRIVVLAFAAAAGLVALRLGGIRFNVTAGT